MAQARYPYTITNGAGEQLTFLGVTRDPDGERLEAEGVAQPGAGPPMHVHRLQEEAVRVILPVLYVVGNALGRYGKYKDAPAPISHNHSENVAT